MEFVLFGKLLFLISLAFIYKRLLRIGGGAYLLPFPGMSVGLQKRGFFFPSDHEGGIASGFVI